MVLLFVPASEVNCLFKRKHRFSTILAKGQGIWSCFALPVRKRLVTSSLSGWLLFSLEWTKKKKTFSVPHYTLLSNTSYL